MSSKRQHGTSRTQKGTKTSISTRTQVEAELEDVNLSLRLQPVPVTLVPYTWAGLGDTSVWIPHHLFRESRPLNERREITAHPPISFNELGFVIKTWKEYTKTTTEQLVAILKAENDSAVLLRSPLLKVSNFTLS